MDFLQNIVSESTLNFLNFWQGIDWTRSYNEIFAQIEDYFSQHPSSAMTWYGVTINQMMTATRYAYDDLVEYGSGDTGVLRKALRYMDEEGAWFCDDELENLWSDHLNFLIDRTDYLNVEVACKVGAFVLQHPGNFACYQRRLVGMSEIHLSFEDYCLLMNHSLRDASQATYENFFSIFEARPSPHTLRDIVDQCSRQMFVAYIQSGRSY